MKTKSKQKNSLGTKAWDLSDLYSGIDDPQIAKDKKKIGSVTKNFIKTYKGKINSNKLTTKFLLQALQQANQLDEKLLVYTYYASLLHEKDNADTKIGKFYQEAMEFDNQITAKLVWFTLELKAIPENIVKKILNEKSFSEYKHYLEKVRIFSKFTLSEKEEILDTKLSQSGIDAFRRLYDESNSAQDYDGQNFSQITKVFSYDPDRNKRQKAGETITKSLKNSAHLYTFIINTLLLNKKTRDEIRGYEYPQHATFLSYEVDPGTVEALTKAVEKRFRLGEEYYKTKAKLMGIKTLHEWDRYAPIFPAKNSKLHWNDCKKLILDNFNDFSPEFNKIAQEFFDNNWIDSEVVPNKSSGAFCSYLVPSKHPYILQNYTGDWRDVTTTAHELGHAIHAVLSKDNNLSNFWPSTATAEIASTFCEAIVTDALLEQTTDTKVKLNILASKIEHSFASIFRQTLFYLFESQLHDHRRTKGELTTKEINNYFQSNLQKMFGTSLKLTDGHAYWWMNVSHFYSYNFYVFTYAFGEALSLALYAKYKVEGESFVKKYTQALALGGSKTPHEIMKTLEIDISDPGFWDQGLDLLEGQIKQFTELAQEI